MRATDFLIESRVGNKLDDPAEFAKALKGFQNYFDPERGENELLGYKGSFDHLNKRGGKIYRVVFADSPEEVRLNDVNEHWTHDSSQIDYYISNLWTYYGKGKKHAFVIEAIVPPMSLSNWGVDLAGNPEEQEVNLVANQNQVKYKLFVLKGTRLEPVSENMDHSKDGQAVEELKAALTAHRKQIQSVNDDDDKVYKIIDKIMTRIAKSHGMSGQKLHDMWVEKYKQIPDTWVMN